MSGAKRFLADVMALSVQRVGCQLPLRTASTTSRIESSRDGENCRRNPIGLEALSGRVPDGVCPPQPNPSPPFGHRPWQQGIWKVDFPSPAPSHAGLFLFEVPHRHARRGGNSWVQPCVRCNPLKRLTRRRTSYPPQRPPGRRGPRGGFSLNREWRQPGQARDFANKVKNCDRRHR